MDGPKLGAYCSEFMTPRNGGVGINYFTTSPPFFLVLVYIFICLHGLIVVCICSPRLAVQVGPGGQLSISARKRRKASMKRGLGRRPKKGVRTTQRRRRRGRKRRKRKQ